MNGTSPRSTVSTRAAASARNVVGKNSWNIMCHGGKEESKNLIRVKNIKEEGNGQEFKERKVKSLKRKVESVEYAGEVMGNRNGNRVCT